MSLLLRTPYHASTLFASPRPANFEDLNSQEQPPQHHIRETDNSIELSLDVPGIKAQDLKVQVLEAADGVLIRVSGERKTTGCELKFFDRSFAVDRKQ